jgi:hypothetical protein
MLEGRYQEALQMWDEYVQRDPRAAQWNMSRGTTRMLCGDPQGALTDFLVFRNRPYAGKFPLPFVGTALWLQGQRAAACEDWANELSRRRSGEFTHMDEAGGVEVPALLWWASAHAGLEEWRKLAVQELKDRDRRNRRVKDYHAGPLRRRERWPGVLAPFLLGQSPEEALRPHTDDFGPYAANRRCGAYFYLGARHLDTGSLGEYRQCLELAVRQGENSLVQPEYHLARAELLALGGEHPQAAPQ